MKVRKIFVFILVVGLTAGCNIPTRGTVTPTDAEPVNVAITALYQTAMAVIPSQTAVPASATPSREVATSTQAVVSTATQAPAQPTSVPPTALPATPVPPTKPAPAQTSAPETAAPFLSKAPTIDGDWAEWKTVAREYPAQYVVYGKANRSGEADLNASFYIGWDADYLYLAVKVRDDVYVQLAQGADIFKGDSIELLLDTNRAGDLGKHVLSSDDYQIGIAPGRPSIADGNPQVYQWLPASKAGDVPGTTVAALQEDGVYRVEAAIPWSTFGVTPVKGMRLGFGLSVSDNDRPGEKIQQSMVSNLPNRNFTDPDTWAVLVLK